MRACKQGAALRAGLSLVEALVVIGVIGILFGLMLPAVQSAREAAAGIQCKNNLRQMGVGLHHYHDVNRRFPPKNPKGAPGTTNDPDTLLSWMALILPMMEQEPLWQTSERACRADAQPFDDPPHVGFGTVIPSYVCPDDGRSYNLHNTESGLLEAFTSYIGIGGVIGSAPPGPGPMCGVLGQTVGPRLTDVTDGTSLTIMVGERPPPDTWQTGGWYTGWEVEVFGGPGEAMWFPPLARYGDVQCAKLKGVSFGPGQPGNPCDRYHLWSLHPLGANFLFADGSVQFLGYSANELIIPLATRSGGEVVALP